MMDVPAKKKGAASKKSSKIIVTVAITVAVLLIVGMIMLAMKGDSSNRKNRVQSITLLKPPPPPKIQEKPPEPEIKKEEIIEELPEPEEQDQPDDASDDDAKAIDDQLGLDSDATGADGFGLRSKKGGRSLLSGDGGDGRFKWYTAMVQKEISERVREYLDKNGGIPDGDLKALVKVELDDDGRIVEYKLLKSSGNQRMDAAILKALAGAGFDDIPPYDMPKALKFRVLSKGKA
jgi:protein TonB